LKRTEKKTCSGFTLVELLVALMVSSIVLGAVASLTFAVGNAYDASEDVSTKQTQIRFAMLRISELIRQSDVVVISDYNGDITLAIWQGDSNGNGKINANELVYIEPGSGNDRISIVEYPPEAEAWEIPLDLVRKGYAKYYMDNNFDEQRINVLPQCSNVSFYPSTINENNDYVSIRFDVDEGGQQKHYEISATIRGKADHLLSGGEIVTGDDD